MVFFLDVHLTRFFHPACETDQTCKEANFRTVLLGKHSEGLCDGREEAEAEKVVTRSRGLRPLQSAFGLCVASSAYSNELHYKCEVPLSER